MTLYQLYYYPLNASMAPHFVLDALQIEYELLLIDRKADEQKSDAYLALNPQGKIPTLVDGDLVLSESAAICIYLAENNADSQLIPVIHSSERAKFFQWILYLSNTLQAELMLYFYPEKHCDNERQAQAIAKKQEQRITNMLSTLDAELANKTYLLGEQISVCDYYLFMLAVWSDEFAKPPLAFEHLGRYLKHMAKDHAVVSVCDKEGLSLADYQ